MELNQYPTPTDSGLRRRFGDFTSLADALDYAAQGQSGINFYSAKGQLSESLPYATLKQQAQRVARQLIQLGLKAGDRVAIVAESDGDFSRIFFGCQYAGMIPVPMPLPAAFAGKEPYIDTLRGMIRNAGARAVVVPDLIRGWTQDIVAGFDLLFGGSPAELMQNAVDEAIELPQIERDAISYLQFSSGSTRFPMGVTVTQQACLANAGMIAQYGLKVRAQGDRAVSWLPLYHDMGLVGFFLTPMTCQLSIDLLPTRDFARRPHVWLDLISRNRGTLSYSPSFGYELCTRRMPSDSMTLDLSCWRVAGIGGDMIRSTILDNFARQYRQYGFNPAAFVASYGMAETTLALSFAPTGEGLKTDTVDLSQLEMNAVAVPAAAASAKTRTFTLCGTVLPAHCLEVRNEHNQVVAERVVGSIYARGPSLMQGYFNQEQETRRVLSADGWLRTGDLGYMLGNEIVIVGREKDLIIVNGRNIWPQDLEWAAEQAVPFLRSHDVAVFPVDQDEREITVALVQCRTSDEAERQKLQAQLTALFRSQHGVEVVVLLVAPHSLPQTSSGKLSRARARQMFLRGEFGIQLPAESVQPV